MIRALKSYERITKNRCTSEDEVAEEMAYIYEALKVLDIIKIRVNNILLWKIVKSIDYEDYVENYCLMPSEYLTKDEYEMIREVLL